MKSLRLRAWGTMRLLVLRGLARGIAPLLLGAVLSTSAGGQVLPGRQLEPISERPELPGWLSDLLPERGYRVVEGGTPKVTFWLLSELPAVEPTGELGIDFGHLPIATLVGVVQLSDSWSDYRKQPIPAGFYTLRYGIQPADGDHTGQSYFRDFLMLVPVAEDHFPAEGSVDQETVAEVSTKATGTEHPAVLALYQIYEPVDEVSIVANDYGEPCLALPFGDVVMGLVLEGWGSGLQL